MITVIYIAAILVLIGSLVAIYIVINNDMLNDLIYKINMCEKDFEEELKKKEDEILRSVNIINRELDLDIKVFEEVRNIKSNKLSLNDKDLLLSRAFHEIKKIYADNYEKLNSVKSFDGIITDMDRQNVRLVSIRTLYNKCASHFNLLNTKIPYKYIIKFRKMTNKPLYEGKELQEVIEKELNNLVI